MHACYVDHTYAAQWLTWHQQMTEQLSYLLWHVSIHLQRLAEYLCSCHHIGQQLDTCAGVEPGGELPLVVVEGPVEPAIAQCDAYITDTAWLRSV